MKRKNGEEEGRAGRTKKLNACRACITFAPSSFAYSPGAYGQRKGHPSARNACNESADAIEFLQGGSKRRGWDEVRARPFSQSTTVWLHWSLPSSHRLNPKNGWRHLHLPSVQRPNRRSHRAGREKERFREAVRKHEPAWALRDVMSLFIASERSVPIRSWGRSSGRQARQSGV
jgi:hypothetical protein